MVSQETLLIKGACIGSRRRSPVHRKEGPSSQAGPEGRAPSPVRGYSAQHSFCTVWRKIYDLLQFHKLGVTSRSHQSRSDWVLVALPFSRPWIHQREPRNAAHRWHASNTVRLETNWAKRAEIGAAPRAHDPLNPPLRSLIPLHFSPALSSRTHARATDQISTASKTPFRARSAMTTETQAFYSWENNQRI